MNKNNLLLSLTIIFFYLILTFVDKTFIVSESKIFDYLANKYPSSVVQNYMESQKKWWWVG